MNKSLIILVCILQSGLLFSQHTVERLPYPINTKDYDEICPLFDYKGETLFFTKVANPNFNKTLIYNGEDLAETLNGEAYEEMLAKIYKIISGKYDEDPYKSTFNQDVWYAQEINGDYKVYHPEFPLNDALPNSICSVYGKENGYVIINQFNEGGGMRAGFSTITMDENGNSSFPEPFTIRNFDKISSEVNLTMSIDKQIIILSMHKANGLDKDLFVSFKLMDTFYSEPVPLVGVNSSGDETTPYLSQDKTKLYFASNRKGGQGGLDLYYSERLDYTYKEWSTPKTYNSFLNTPFNESHPFVSNDGEEIYYTSDSRTSSDIFKAQIYRDTLIGPITLKVSVIKESTGKNFPAEITWKNTFDESDEWPNYWRARDGYHQINIDKNEPINIKAENRSLKSQIVTIDPQELQDKGLNEYFIELVLTKEGILKVKDNAPEDVEEEVVPELGYNLEEGKQVILKNIYFKRSKPDLLPESFEAIKALAQVIKSKPNLVIQIEGHTDNIGDRKSLMDLSTARAVAIKELLIGMDVKEYQLKTKGFGAKNPITDNSDEAHRRRNRRVEIRVLNK